MKLPAFQFYPGDWRKDPGVQSLDYFSRGVWIEILCMMHESERRGLLLLNGKAMPHDALARLLGLEPVLLKQILTTLDNHGVTSIDPETGALASRRMVRDENLRKTRAEAGKMGGNPILLNQNPITQLKQIPTPSSSSSSSEVNAQTKNGPPTLDDVKAYGQMRGVKPEDCEQFWHHFESTGWIDKNGHQIAKWQSKLMTWEVSAQQVKPSGQRQPFISELKTVLEAKKALRDAIHNRGHEDALGWRAKTPEDAAEHKRLNKEIAALINQIAEHKP